MHVGLYLQIKNERDGLKFSGA